MMISLLVLVMTDCDGVSMAALQAQYEQNATESRLESQSAVRMASVAAAARVECQLFIVWISYVV
jgi:hypothetical protein